MTDSPLISFREESRQPLTTEGPPQARLEVNPAGTAVEVAVSGNLPMVRAATGGSAELLQLLAMDIATLPGRLNELDDFSTDAALAFVEHMAPRDPAEAAFLVQMVAIHRAIMNTAFALAKAKSPQEREAHEKALNRLARTSAAQLETLRGYRNHGHQTVRVERVTVEAGGQAVVGHVEANKGRGR